MKAIRNHVAQRGARFASSLAGYCARFPLAQTSSHYDEATHKKFINDQSLAELSGKS